MGQRLYVLDVLHRRTMQLARFLDGRFNPQDADHLTALKTLSICMAGLDHSMVNVWGPPEELFEEPLEWFQETEF